MIERIDAAVEAGEDLADEIERLALAAERLFTTRLTNKTIVVLLSRESGLGQRDVAAVLDALPRLKSCLKKKPAK